MASVGSFNDWQKEKQFLRLQAESDKDNTVSTLISFLNFSDFFLLLRSLNFILQIIAMRRGKEETIHHNNIQVGDILKIRAGMNIPVDGIIIRSSGVDSNESAMTGESDNLKKDTMENCKARQVEKDAEYEYLK